MQIITDGDYRIYRGEDTVHPGGVKVPHYYVVGPAIIGHKIAHSIEEARKQIALAEMGS